MIIGCPIYARSWILEKWYAHVLDAVDEAKINELAFVFVVDSQDKDMTDCINHTVHEPVKLVVLDQKNAADHHQWNHNRFQEMVWLRNELLQTVRGIDPDLFLSLDSDILLHSQIIKNLIEDLDRFDAVGGKCYMTERGVLAPSYAMMGQSGTLIRPDAYGVIPVDVIMAIKLMTPAAFRVNYDLADHGEDIGWSKNCRDRGLKLGWDGRVCSKHVMTREMLGPVDERCGF